MSSELVPNMASIDWDLRRDGLEGSLATNLENSGIDRERAFELAEQIVAGIEDFSNIGGVSTHFPTPAADAEEIEVKFTLSGSVKVRI